MMRQSSLRVGEALTKSMNSWADLGGAMLSLADENWRQKTVIGLKIGMGRVLSIESE